MSEFWFSPKRLAITVSLFLCLFTASAFTETVYRYKDEQGKWHFTNRKEKAPEKAELQQFRLSHKQLHPKVLIKDNAGVKQLVAINPYFGPVQAVAVLNNQARVSAMVEAQGETVLLNEMTDDQKLDESGFIWGKQINDTPASLSLVLPVAKSSEAKFSQAFNGAFSHNHQGSRYAVDIPMNVGSNIHAAREGIVMMVKDDYHMGGVDQFFLDKANQVAVLHDDGSIAIYGHILLGTAKVKAGNLVQQGQILAQSGSSGYSSGPHLHFVVLKNNRGKNVSIPFTFNVGGKEVTPQQGMVLFNP